MPGRSLGGDLPGGGHHLGRDRGRIAPAARVRYYGAMNDLPVAAPPALSNLTEYTVSELSLALKTEKGV